MSAVSRICIAIDVDVQGAGRGIENTLIRDTGQGGQNRTVTICAADIGDHGCRIDLVGAADKVGDRVYRRAIRVGCRASILEHILARAAGQRVLASATIQGVVTGTAVQGVVAAIAAISSLPSTAGDDVHGGVTRQSVIAATARDRDRGRRRRVVRDKMHIQRSGIRGGAADATGVEAGELGGSCQQEAKLTPALPETVIDLASGIS